MLQRARPFAAALSANGKPLAPLRPSLLTKRCPVARAVTGRNPPAPDLIAAAAPIAGARGDIRAPAELSAPVLQGPTVQAGMSTRQLAVCSMALAAAAYAAPALADTVTTMNPSIMDLATLLIPGIVGDSPVREGIVSGFLLIFFSEIGDKTFFIALLLALRQPKAAVFAGTFGALAVMTVISVGLGQGLHQLDELVPQTSAAAKIPYDDLIAAALLVWFGIQTLRDAKDAAESAEEEKEEAKEAVDGFGADDTIRLVLSTFALVFAAEWGDKSFLATIALAASSSPIGVVTGAVAGHGVATGLAVAGGSLLSKYFSPSLLQYFGGSLFLLFAAATVVDIVAKLNP